MSSIRRLQPADWGLYRETRLAALRDAPDAFGSTFDREAAFADDEWRNRLVAAVTSDRDLPLVAEDNGVAVGLTWARLGDDATVVNLYQVWVHPSMRRRGVGQMLIDAAAAWAIDAGAKRLVLSVALGPRSALEFYRHQGFVEVGSRSRLREGSEVWQQSMERLLR